MITQNDLVISEKNYKRTRLVLDILRRFLKVNIKVHNLTGQFETGDIFLFNHFARFETFIPQYLIFEETGKISRSLAAPELFRDDTFGKYLMSIGAVPTNLPDIIHFMACEINRGYKTIIFPEGSMIKDRRVLGPKGRFRIYAREEKTYRKPHTGAAVIALYAQQLRDLFILTYERKNQKTLKQISSLFKIDDPERFLSTASRPVMIIPANITFHPLRGDDNFLRKISERMGRIKNNRMEEELIIEGNILFKDTDMDIRLGDPIPVKDYLGRTDSLLLKSRYFMMNEAMLKGAATRLLNRLEIVRSEILSERIMTQYMKSIYSLVTVNMEHLCAEIIYELIRKYKQREVSKTFFVRSLYLTIKKLQRAEGVFLHRGLQNPDRYDSLLKFTNRDLRDFLINAAASGLIQEKDHQYLFLPALEQSYDFDVIRIKNFIKVRYNEVQPVPAVREMVHEVLTQYDKLNTPQSRAALLYDDDKRSYVWDQAIFCKSKYEEINKEETRVQPGDPFFFIPEHGVEPKAGVLLIHGLSASPAEMRPLGEFLSEQGLFAYGVRLKGHGTSPCDLDFRKIDQWYHSAFRGWEALRCYCDKIFVAGFSMGGCIALKLAAEHQHEVTGIVSISTPLRIRNKNILFASLANQINRLVAVLPYLNGIKRFKKSFPENPGINYQNIPISAIHEFKKLMEQTEVSLGEIYQPALIIQSKGDPTVDPVSAEMIMKGITSKDKRLLMIDSNKHVIVLDKGSLVHQEILKFIREHSGGDGAGRDKSRGFQLSIPLSPPLS